MCLCFGERVYMHERLFTIQSLLLLKRIFSFLSLCQINSLRNRFEYVFEIIFVPFVIELFRLLHIILTFSLFLWLFPWAFYRTNFVFHTICLWNMWQNCYWATLNLVLFFEKSQSNMKTFEEILRKNIQSINGLRIIAWIEAVKTLK